MKIKSKLPLMISLAALATSPLALADKGTPTKADAPEVTEAEPVVIESEITPDGGEVGDGITDETPVKDVVSEEPKGGVDPVICQMTGGHVDPAVCEVADGEAVPIDWVKRGGGDDGALNPDVMFQNSVGEAPVFKGETAPAVKELGQNEKASNIEAQGGPLISQVKRDKKVPVALIKKGRVFLR